MKLLAPFLLARAATYFQRTVRTIFLLLRQKQACYWKRASTRMKWCHAYVEAHKNTSCGSRLTQTSHTVPLNWSRSLQVVSEILYFWTQLNLRALRILKNHRLEEYASNFPIKSKIKDQDTNAFVSFGAETKEHHRMCNSQSQVIASHVQIARIRARKQSLAIGCCTPDGALQFLHWIAQKRARSDLWLGFPRMLRGHR